MTNDYARLSGPRRFGKEAPGFMVYKEGSLLAIKLEDKAAGGLFKALCRYHLIGEVSSFDDEFLQGIFDSMKEAAERSYNSYFKSVDKGKKGHAAMVKARTQADGQARAQVDGQARAQVDGQARAQVDG